MLKNYKRPNKLECLSFADFPKVVTGRSLP